MLSFRNNKSLFFGLFVLLILLVSIPLYNIKGFYYNCFSALDVGIYLEAILKLSKFEDINPFLLIRQYKIFNDHVDPIIILGIPFVLIFPPLVGAVLFEFSFLLTAVLLIIKKYKNTLGCLALAIFLLLNSRGILSAYMDPIHPSSFVLPLTFLLVFFAFEKKESWLVITVLSFLLFKESYVFSVLGCLIYFLIKRKFKTSAFLFIVCILHSCFVYIIRPKWMGDVVPYSNQYIGLVVNHPLKHFLYITKNLDYKSYAYFFLPYFPALIFILKKENFWKNTNSPIWILICFSLPIIGIHIILNMIYKHHSVFPSSLIIGIIIFSPYFMDFIKNKIFVTLTICALLFSSSRHYTRIFKYLFSNNVRTCEMTKERSASLCHARKLVQSISENQKILASSGFIPYAQTQNRHFYHLGKYMNFNIDYDYLVLERGGKGYHLPCTPEEIEEIILSYSQGELYKDKYIAIFKPTPNLQSSSCLKKIIEVK